MNKINNMLNKLPSVIKKQLNLSKFKNINLVKSLCNVCKSKKSKFVSKQDVSGFLSQFFSKIPILNKII